MFSPHRSFTAFVLMTCFTLIGCGDKADPDRHIIKGRLVDGGKAFTLDISKVTGQKSGLPPPPGIQTNSILQITFVRAEGNDTILASTNAETGTFEVAGPDGKGIKPGRYKIAITARLGITPDTPDYFKGRYTLEKTEIVREIKAGEEVVIDISKPKG